MICPHCATEHAVDGGCPARSGLAQRDPLIGTSIGDYGLVRELGRGTGGVVYLAEHLATGLNVAIKLARGADERVGRRMSLEARFANQIALESVVNVFDVNIEEPLGPYLVMEYLQGEPFADLVAPRLAPAEAMELLAQVADALGEAHELHIVHAALKPSNVIRTLNDKKAAQAKLLPFGVATGARVRDEEPEDREVAKLGSPDFRAPEQTLGAPADPRMDVYSLGAIAYLLATGRVPFMATTPEGLERAHAEVMATAPHRVDSRVSRSWSATILRALEKSPEQRYQTARELAEAFRAAAAVPAPVATSTAAFGYPSSPNLPSPPAPVVAGLADGFMVTTTPLPQRAPESLQPPGTPAHGVSTAAKAAQDRPAYRDVISPRPSAPSGIATPAPTLGLVLRVMVTDERGGALGDFACSSVTRAGLIVCTGGVLPALLSRVKLNFPELGGLSCNAQVVHHVTPAQASQWKLSAGYGVQFEALSPAQRTLLESAHQGLKLPETPSGIAQRSDDPAAEEILKRFSGERALDGYAMLSISKGAPFDAIRDRIRDARRALEGLSSRPLSTAQQKSFEAAKARLDEVGKTLCEAMSRLEYDAERGNFEGVARCISAGVSVAELESVRTKFLKTHPGIAGKSHGDILAGQTLEARMQMPQALEAYADALRTDPLNLMAQQRYWAVRRQLDKT